MKSLERILKRVFRGLVAGITLAQKNDSLVRLGFEPATPPLVGLVAARETVAAPRGDTLETAFAEAVDILRDFLADADREERARVDALMCVASRLGYFCFAGTAGGIYLAPRADSGRNMREDLEHLDGLFRRHLGVGLSFAPAASDAPLALAERRADEARKFFVRDKGPWIQNFMDALQDDISRDSLLTYLRQRIIAKIFWASDICYPVEPPDSTAPWRREREAAAHAYPVLKNMRGDIIDAIHYKYVYVYEQYGLPGRVEVRPGDTVIDAGAFVGDSSIYFSRLAGPEGHVYAFEIFPDSVVCGRENMQRNGASNVEYVNAALSDRTGTAKLLVDENCSSQSKIVFNGDADGSTVETVTLDAFRKGCGPIDFIKADIEGSEMAMLRGARETLATDGPTCALCVYHKRDDFWEIPVFLASARPDYKFWFRCEAEPVVFASCRT